MSALPSQFQHHVPRFYLKGWSTTAGLKPNRIWVYKKGKKPRHQAIKETGGRENMYAVAKADGSIDLDIVERYIARAESRAGKVFAKIMRHKPLLPIEKEVLAMFISVMYRRDTYTLDAFAPKKLAPLIPGLHQEMRDAAQFVSDPQLQKNYLDAVEKAIELTGKNLHSVTSQAILNSEPMGKLVFNRLNWCFMYSQTSSFVTSDCPVVFNRFKGIRDPTHGHVIFPISSKLILWMTQWPIFANSYSQVPDKLIDNLNARIVRNAHKEVYTDHESVHIQNLVDQAIGTDLPHSGG